MEKKELTIPERCIITLENVDKILTALQQVGDDEIIKLPELIRTTQQELDIPLVIAAIRDQSKPSEQKPPTKIYTQCMGKIQSSGFCDQCGQLGAQTTTSICGRLLEQKPPEGAEEISYRAWRTLVNSGWANVQGEILNAMQEYADLQKKQLTERVKELERLVKFAHERLESPNSNSKAVFNHDYANLHIDK